MELVSFYTWLLMSGCTVHKDLLWWRRGGMVSVLYLSVPFELVPMMQFIYRKFNLFDSKAAGSAWCGIAAAIVPQCRRLNHRSRSTQADRDVALFWAEYKFSPPPPSQPLLPDFLHTDDASVSVQVSLLKRNTIISIAFSIKGKSFGAFAYQESNLSFNVRF